MKVYTHAVRIPVDIVDAFCALEGGFTDQFVYYPKDVSDTTAGRSARRLMGLGRCIALHDLDEIEYIGCGDIALPPFLFSFNRFDAGAPQPVDPLFESFPHLSLMLPELVFLQEDGIDYLQVNSLGPISDARVRRFVSHVADAPVHRGTDMAYRLEEDDECTWGAMVAAALEAIGTGTVDKVVVSRRLHLVAEDDIRSRDLLANLVDNASRGTVYLYRYDDVFFVGVTPELLVRKDGTRLDTMCLAGSIGVGADDGERAALGRQLLADGKNLREHAFVVEHLSQVLARTCHEVSVPGEPRVLSLDFIQHLWTPLSAEVFEDMQLMELMREFHPTPALCGYPVGQAKAVLRRIEPYNRGFFGGAIGYVDGDGDGEFSVAIRCGVFDQHEGYVYAGCGIVPGSDAAEEREETACKCRTILSAFSAVGR